MQLWGLPGVCRAWVTEVFLMPRLSGKQPAIFFFIFFSTSSVSAHAAVSISQTW